MKLENFFTSFFSHIQQQKWARSQKKEMKKMKTIKIYCEMWREKNLHENYVPTFFMNKNNTSEWVGLNRQEKWKLKTASSEEVDVRRRSY